MNDNNELKQIIRSRYPVVYIETIDEGYTVKQLVNIANEVDLVSYVWSLTDGLKVLYGEAPYYKTKDPKLMLQTIHGLIATKENNGVKPGLFILKDFDKYLEDPLTVRLFKDIINSIKETRNTIAITSSEYKLPKEIEIVSIHITDGYPSEEEIKIIIDETTEDLKKYNNKTAVSLNNEELNKTARALKGLSAQQIRNIINSCVVDDNIFDINDFGGIEKYKKKVFDQDGILEFYLSEDKNSIAGFNNLKRWLNERKNSFNLNRSSQLPSPKGVVLMGVQGCGKSLAVKAIASELCLPLYRLDLGRLYSKYIGETENKLREALTVVEKLSPICLWIDEIEKGFASSGADIDGGVSQRILGTFLTWMQERKSDCFVAATANDVYHLPPEFLRKGRFDEIFFVDLPDKQTRNDIFSVLLSKRKLNATDFDINKMGELSSDFSGAEIEQAIISASYRASSNKEQITTQHITEQLESTKPLSVLKHEEIKSLRLWAKERTISA